MTLKVMNMAKSHVTVKFLHKIIFMLFEHFSGSLDFAAVGGLETDEERSS